VPGCRRAEPAREGIRQPPASVERDRPAGDSVTERFPPDEPTLEVARSPVHHQIRFVARIDSTRCRPDRSEYEPIPGGRLGGAHLDHRLARRQPIELHRLTHPESQSGGIELLGGRITEGPPHRPLAEGEQCSVEVPTGRRQCVLDDLASAASAPVHHSDRLEVTEALHQHGPGDAREVPVQLVEPARPVEQIAHDQHAPAVADRLDGDRQRAVLTEASHRSSVNANLAARQVRFPY
jgi:hypothetical protein